MATTTTADKALYNETLKIDAELKALIAHIQQASKSSSYSGAMYENSVKSVLNELAFNLKAQEEKYYKTHVHVYEMQVNKPLSRLTPEQMRMIDKMRGK